MKKKVVGVICGIIFISGMIICSKQQLGRTETSDKIVENIEQVKQEEDKNENTSNTKTSNMKNEEDEDFIGKIVEDSEQFVNDILEGDTMIYYDDTKNKSIEEAGAKEFVVKDVSDLSALQVIDNYSYITIEKSKSKDMKVSLEYKLRMPKREQIDQVKELIELDMNRSNDTCKLGLKNLSNGKSFWSILDEIKGNRYISLHMKIYMPENFNRVKLETETGYVYVSDIKGELDVDTETGYVYISDIKGELDVDTETGYVYISDSVAELEVCTDTGYIDFTNVEFIGNCIAKSETGYIDAELTSTNDAGADVSFITEEGYVNCTLPKKVSDKLNFSMSTDTGNIDIDLNGNKASYSKRKKQCIVCTIGEKNNIKATTSSGEVFVKE